MKRNSVKLKYCTNCERVFNTEKDRCTECSRWDNYPTKGMKADADLKEVRL